MTVEVVLPGALRDLAGGAAVLVVDLPGPAPLEAVLESAFSPWPLLGLRVRDERGRVRRHVNVFVDGHDVRRGQGLQTLVGPAATVHVVNAVSGG